jgi:Asp-tRNA(Asn)/Glu-tRNA(Gln) amidotransferase A subunit family amidase
MTGPAPGCPAVLRPKLELPLDYPSNRWKAAVCMDQGWATLDPEVRTLALAAAGVLEAEGVLVDEVELPLDTTDIGLRETIEKALFSTALGADLLEVTPERDRLTTYGRRFLDLAANMGPEQAKQAAEEALRCYRIIDERIFQAGYDVMISPTVATTNIAADFDPTKDRVTVAGKTVDPYSGWFLTSIFSLLNWMPVFAVPLGLTANGLPAGLQIAARPYDDATAAAVASLYARHVPSLPFERLAPFN